RCAERAARLGAGDPEPDRATDVQTQLPTRMPDADRPPAEPPASAEPAGAEPAAHPDRHHRVTYPSSPSKRSPASAAGPGAAARRYRLTDGGPHWFGGERGWSAGPAGRPSGRGGEKCLSGCGTLL